MFGQAILYTYILQRAYGIIVNCVTRFKISYGVASTHNYEYLQILTSSTIAILGRKIDACMQFTTILYPLAI